MSSSLSQLLATSFDRHSVPESVTAFVKQIIGDRQPIGVIYYGSSLWKKELTGLLDFYVVCQNLSDWYPEDCFKIVINYCLPPNIEYHEWSEGNVNLRAKVAILSIDQLQKATALQSIDTTMWARFCQPVKILWWKDDKGKQALLDCLIRAVNTAIWWATFLGPEYGTAEKYWCSLFRHTYDAELRVESNNRPMLILENREDYFKQLLKLGWQKAGISYNETKDCSLFPSVSKDQREYARKRWKIRKILGRPLNICRLIKAAFTFEGGAQYIVWKINRHRDINLELTAFQKKYPLINAPWILFKLYRQGLFKR